MDCNAAVPGTPAAASSVSVVLWNSGVLLPVPKKGPMAHPRERLGGVAQVPAEPDCVCGSCTQNLPRNLAMLPEPFEGEAEPSGLDNIACTCGACWNRTAYSGQPVCKRRKLSFVGIRGKDKGTSPGAKSWQPCKMTGLQAPTPPTVDALELEMEEECEAEADQKVADEWLRTAPPYVGDMIVARLWTYRAREQPIQLSYLCRRNDCRFFGRDNRAKTWVQSKTAYVFRCPSCGYRRLAFSRHADDLLAQRVLAVTDPETGDLMHIPTELPPSENEDFLNNAIEAEARVLDSTGDVVDWWLRARGDVHALLTRESAGLSWAQIPYRPESHSAHIDTNCWDDTEQVKAGYVVGAQLSDAEAARRPYSNFSELIHVFGMMLAASKALVDAP